MAELVAFWSEVGEEEQIRLGPRETGERLAIRTFSEIPRYFAALKEEKIYLENQIRKLRAEVMDLNNKKTEAEHQLEKSLRDNAITAEHLNWYSEVKAELHKAGLEVADVKKFVSAARWVKENGVNLVQVIRQFPSYQNLFQGVILMENKLADLERKEVQLANVVENNHLKVSEIENLKSLGFGLREVRLLHQTLKEIFEANGLASTDESATKRFLTDVENEYDSFVGFKAKLDGLKNECKRLREERNREIAKLDTIPYLGGMISTLFRKGLTEVDILQIASLFHNYPGFIDVWSNFKAKRAKEGDSKPKPEPGVVKNQNLREEAEESNENLLDNSDRDSPAPRNKDESDGEELEA